MVNRWILRIVHCLAVRKIGTRTKETIPTNESSNSTENEYEEQPIASQIQNTRRHFRIDFQVEEIYIQFQLLKFQDEKIVNSIHVTKTQIFLDIIN